jgi:hypothetical protein
MEALNRSSNEHGGQSHGRTMSWSEPGSSHVSPSLGPLLLGFTFTLMPIAFLIVALRLYSNKATPGVGLGWEDYTIMPAVVSSLAILDPIRN